MPSMVAGSLQKVNRLNTYALNLLGWLMAEVCTLQMQKPTDTGEVSQE